MVFCTFRRAPLCHIYKEQDLVRPDKKLNCLQWLVQQPESQVRRTVLAGPHKDTRPRPSRTVTPRQSLSRRPMPRTHHIQHRWVDFTFSFLYSFKGQVTRKTIEPTFSPYTIRYFTLIAHYHYPPLLRVTSMSWLEKGESPIKYIRCLYRT